MPAPSPCVRIEQVARDLGRLAEELKPYAGSDAKRTLLYWRDELLMAITQLERSADFGPTPGCAESMSGECARAAGGATRSATATGALAERR